MVEYKPFCPYAIDLDDFKEYRAEFDIHEWIDVILTAIDDDPAGYVDETGAESEKRNCFFAPLAAVRRKACKSDHRHGDSSEKGSR